MEIRELHDLFDKVDHTSYSNKLSFPSDYHTIPIPICQHNIYKYSPLHIIKLETDEQEQTKFLIVFPESRKQHFIDLDCPNFGEIEKSTINITPKTKEDNGVMFQVEFLSTPLFNIEDLMAQMYLSYVNQYNLESWYDLMKKEEERQNEHHPIFPATELIQLSPQEILNIESIYEKTSQGRYLGQASQEIREMAKELEPRLKEALHKLNKQARLHYQENISSPFFFFKLNTRSPKDSVFYKDKSVFASIDKNKESYQLKKCQATNAHEVVSALVSSSRIHDDCKGYREWRVKEEAKPPLLLVLQEWRTFDPEMEFRCFVFNHQLTSVGQLCWEKHILSLDDNSFKNKILSSIENLFSRIKDVIPWGNCIMDVIYDSEKDFSQICEFNPWGPYSCTGSQIHNWELDEDILFGDRHKIENRNKPFFRTLKKGMLVLDHFDLYVPKTMCTFSPEFLEKMNKIEGRCVCCVRKKRHETILPLPPKPLTNLVHIVK